MIVIDTKSVIFMGREMANLPDFEEKREHRNYISLAEVKDLDPETMVIIFSYHIIIHFFCSHSKVLDILQRVDKSF